MIDESKTTTYRFPVSVDYINRKHKYNVYSPNPRRLVLSTYKIQEAMHFINNRLGVKYWILVSYYLGSDCHFYPFERTYYYLRDNQLLLFN